MKRPVNVPAVFRHHGRHVCNDTRAAAVTSQTVGADYTVALDSRPVVVHIVLMEATHIPVLPAQNERRVPGRHKELPVKDRRWRMILVQRYWPEPASFPVVEPVAILRQRSATTGCRRVENVYPMVPHVIANHRRLSVDVNVA